MTPTSLAIIFIYFISFLLLNASFQISQPFCLSLPANQTTVVAMKGSYTPSGSMLSFPHLFAHHMILLFGLSSSRGHVSSSLSRSCGVRRESCYTTRDSEDKETYSRRACAACRWLPLSRRFFLSMPHSLSPVFSLLDNIRTKTYCVLFSLTFPSSSSST